MKRLIGLSVVLCLVILAGCAQQCTYRQDELIVSKKGVLAVIPFENLAGYPSAGLIAAELFQAELYAQTHGRVKTILAETVAGKLAPLEGKALSPKEVGDLLGAELLVVGRVTEYGYKHGLGEDPAVGVSVRLIEARSGRVLWSGARSQTGRYSWIKQDGLSRLAQLICHRLVDDLMDEDY